jgi:hypothetical protein
MRFEHWIQGVSDLDAIDRASARAAIANDPDLGATPDERLNNIARARRLAGGLTFFSAVAGCWFLFFPYPHDLLVAMLVCLPPTGMVLLATSRGLYRLDSTRRESWSLLTFKRTENLPPEEDPRASILTMVSVPSLILAMRALSDLRTLHVEGAEIFAAVGTVVGIVLLFTARRRTQLTGVLCLGYLMFMCAWGFGTGMMLNANFDWTPPELFRTRVLSKTIFGDKIRNSALHVAPWGPSDAGDEVPVSDKLFDEVQPGDFTCVALHGGLFGVQWYAAAECAADAKSVNEN